LPALRLLATSRSVLLATDRFGARAARAAPGGLLEDLDG